MRTIALLLVRFCRSRVLHVCASFCCRSVEFLRKRKPNAQQNWTDRLPTMAQRLEGQLFLQSTSEPEYSDRSTLHRRLKEVAVKMGANSKQHELLRRQQQARMLLLQQQRQARLAAGVGTASLPQPGVVAPSAALGAAAAAAAGDTRQVNMTDLNPFMSDGTAGGAHSAAAGMPQLQMPGYASNGGGRAPVQVKVQPGLHPSNGGGAGAGAAPTSRSYVAHAASAAALLLV